MGRLPKEVMEKWTKIKHELLSAIDKISDPTVDEAHKKDLKKKVSGMYDQFDAGLSKTLKQANDAKTDKDALKPLSEAIKTASSYVGKVETAQAGWGDEDNGIGDKMVKAAGKTSNAPVREKRSESPSPRNRSPRSRRADTHREFASRSLRCVGLRGSYSGAVSSTSPAPVRRCFSERSFLASLSKRSGVPAGRPSSSRRHISLTARRLACPSASAWPLRTFVL